MNLSQARPNILPQIFLTGCFLQVSIETQNLGKAQALGAFPAVTRMTQIITSVKLCSREFGTVLQLVERLEED